MYMTDLMFYEGENLFHCAVRNKASSALKVLVARDDLKEELLAKNQRGLTPFQTAQELLVCIKEKAFVFTFETFLVLLDDVQNET